MIKMNRQKGQVYKAHSDKYYVKINGEQTVCGARGLLKMNSDGILVGDYVEVENKMISKVSERKNRFIRPNVANIDIIIAVLSPEPKPDYYLIDKLLINAVKEDVEFCLVLNKTDIDSDIEKQLKTEYESLGVKIISISAKENIGIDKLKDLLKDKFALLAGQSAVGKTSIVNALFNLNLKTGELSEKIVRGKHTTTRSEIFEQDGIKIIDSPGFAVIDADVNVKQLPDYYNEYVQHAHECKFRGCTHISEPNCKIKELFNDGTLSKKRYDRYVEIYNELSKRRIIYDKN